MYPVQRIAAGTAIGQHQISLFQPFNIRGCHFQNKIWVSPMCQYSSVDGELNDFHFSHITAMALRGPSLTIIEATAVVPEGRITPYDCGLWNDAQEARLAKMTKFVHAYKQKVGIQLAHAGRKASTKPPWQLSRGMRSEVAGERDGGWPDDVVGPGDESWGDGHAEPHAMTPDDINGVIAAFAASAERAVRAAVDVIEIHAAHGYLLSSFLSPLSNKRTDRYGGSLANRMRLTLEIVDAVRKVIPISMPLLLRISSTEWVSTSPAWDNESTVQLALELHARNVDVLTLSSGGQSSHQRVPKTLDYQTSIASAVRHRLRSQGCSIAIGAVGRIQDPRHANALLQAEDPAGDVVLIGRQFLKEPSWVLRAAEELGVKIQWPVQYQLGRYGLETKL